MNHAGRIARSGPRLHSPATRCFSSLRRVGTLYYGDNLDILRRYLKDESVELVYLDPPFNSAQNYNALLTPPALPLRAGVTIAASHRQRK